ncbi:RNA-binding protein S4 [Pacificitalea manganoxidans]|uniref:RNA-binding protein S4 n=1 Tax=Pacificitalea manganoxidans TaxID=1411902 RepID=A0A291LXB2_9RHOB|nr:RNA-binding S4 domain-containing protein [Pacificitalea manganoxidans]ATI41331.1 RNA-binding protein S4 [Pacificitalea manganoxidans]MDR6308731.1 ribosome-associated heat shock protein Hsp15 [Pacificitalea manganoxidans]
MSAAGTIRIDKWLWHARFFKTRTLAARIVSGGKVRVNGTPVSKPARTVGPGDTLTFAQGDDIRVIRILAPGERRGPAPEAQALYEDLDPPQPRSRERPPDNPAYDGKGRPDKRARRNLDLMRGRDLE